MKLYRLFDIAAILLVAGFLGYAGVFYLKPEAVVGRPASAADVSGDKKSAYMPAQQDSPDSGKLEAEPAVLAANAWEVSETILSEPETIYISSPDLTRVPESSPSSSAVSESGGAVLSNLSTGGSSSVAAAISSSTSSSSSGSSSAASSASGSNSAKADSSSASSKTSEASPQPSTAGNGAGTLPVNIQEKEIPDWIRNEKIRAGYLFFDSPPGYARMIKEMGLNTVIVKGYQFYESQTQKTLNAYRKWGLACRQEGLHMFAAYNWQPQESHKKNFRAVVFSDGTEGVFPCPLDDRFWEGYLKYIAEQIAEISMYYSVPVIDGIFLDLEMYGTENQESGKRHYSLETCFCDNCFSDFIAQKTLYRSFPYLQKSKRKSWLQQNGLLGTYFVWQQERAEGFAEELKQTVHAVNPQLLFGVYPALSQTNPIQRAVMRAFGRQSYPVISFSTDTYGYIQKPWGSDRIPSDLAEYFSSYDIHGIYVAGYLFRKYSSNELPAHLMQSCKKSQGYWLYTLCQLYWNQLPAGYELADGTPTDYIRAIRTANAYLGY